jgi:hypothetical protein
VPSTHSSPIALSPPHAHDPSRYTLWPAKGHTFPRLRLKHKPNLISLAGGMEGLPVTDPAARATPLEPGAWKAMLDSASADPVRIDMLVCWSDASQRKYGYLVGMFCRQTPLQPRGHAGQCLR